MRLQGGASGALLVLSWMGAVATARIISDRQDASSRTTLSLTSTTTPFYPSVATSSPVSVATSSPVTTTSSSSPAVQTTNFGDATLAPTLALQTSASPSPTAISSDQLPIAPVISPALGLAGAFLMIAGLALTLIGIKHAWLHVFLSTALLSSLAVTVLIIYVMNPPVSNAVQGAYFVGAFATGLIIGGMALIFKEVTEGLGCLLGGFCLAMWFLCLAPGGLTSSQVGRGVLIGVFCAIAWALAFSRYTRTYGLIFCTAFAGATATMLGIDCFTRAGLKEFWIYIWNLNNSEFPLGTNSYPITRGIRVEIACTVVMAVFGILSQLRIWKMVKARRDRKDAEKLRDEEDREHIDRTVGRYVQRVNQRSLARWEAVYGGQVHDDTELELTDKPVVSTREEEREAMSETDTDVQQSKRTSKTNWASSATLTGRASSDYCGLHHDSTFAKDAERPVHDETESSRSSSRSSTHSHSGRASTEQLVQSPTIDKHRSTASTVPPALIPLPFKVPSRPTSHITSRHSRSSYANAHALDDGDGVQLADLAPVTSIHDVSRRQSSVLSVEDEVATSVAATVDDVANLESLSQHRLSAGPSLAVPDTGNSGDAFEGADFRRTSFIEQPLDEDDEEAIVHSPAQVYVEPTEALALPRPTSLHSAHFRRSVTSEAKSPDPADGPASVVGSLSGHLQDRLSRAATTFRTNEWAKHIAGAEHPIEDEIASSSPGIKVDPVFAQEAAKPVDIDALDDRPVAPGDRMTTRQGDSRLNRNRDSVESKASLARRQSTTGATSLNALGRSNSEASLLYGGSAHLAASREALALSRHPSKSTVSVAMPLSAQPLIESPAETIPPTIPLRAHRPVSRGQSLRTGSRNGRPMPQQVGSALHSLHSAPNLHVTAPSDTASEHHYIAEGYGAPIPRGNAGVEDVLAERKTLVHSASQPLDSVAMSTFAPQRGLQRGLSNHSITPLGATAMSPAGGRNSRSVTPGQPTLIYDSHQPKRDHGIDVERQAALQAQWRESLQHSMSSPRTQPALFDAAQMNMLNERRQAEWHQQQQQAERVSRQSAIDMAMRSGQMHNAHRDAMRKMQARARRLSQT